MRQLNLLLRKVNDFGLLFINVRLNLRNHLVSVVQEFPDVFDELDPLTCTSDLLHVRVVVLYKLGSKIALDPMMLIFDKIVYVGPRRA